MLSCIFKLLIQCNNFFVTLQLFATNVWTSAKISCLLRKSDDFIKLREVVLHKKMLRISFCNLRKIYIYSYLLPRKALINNFFLQCNVWLTFFYLASPHSSAQKNTYPSLQLLKVQDRPRLDGIMKLYIKF